MALIRILSALVRRLWVDTAAATVPIVAIVLPPLLIGVAAGGQYGFLNIQKTALQGVADEAALGAAKGLALSTSDSSTVAQAAVSMVQAALVGNAFAQADNITAKVVDNNTGVEVVVSRSMKPILGSVLGASSYAVKARAVAHVYGSTVPICIIGLDARRKGTLSLDTNAVVQANACAAYSNSNHPWSISAVDSAILKTGLTCAVGGKHGNFPNFAPQPKSGCPPIHDPLLARAAPSVGPCDHTNFTATTNTTLQPGVYCGGLKISGPYTVSLASGTYILTNGPLLVEKGGSLSGVNVGFYLSGTGAVINFQAASTISLTAPKIGIMAGLLFFEDRSSPAGQLHQVLSNNAQTLLGTIYLSQGRFFVGANAPVAGNSAYTIVVADTLELSAGPTFVLNSNYGATDIPVPKGVGPTSSTTRLDF